jgi:sugar lactone lactonase YvrE
VFDHDPLAGLTGRRPFVRLGPDDGGPDGLTVDAEGGVWVALWGGGCVRRYTSEGVLDGVVEVPARQVTACTFGGDRLDQLFITTSRQGLEPDEEPVAGALFSADVGVRGRPVHAFAG